jgi:fructokinase
MGVDTAFVAIDDRHPTGTVTVRMEEGGVPSYTIHEGVAWDHIAFADRTRDLASRTDALCFGTLAQRSETSRQSILRFLESVRPDCLRICDVNLRQRYYSRAIVQESLQHCDVFKLNNEELPLVAELLSLKGSDSAIVRKMIDAFSLKLIALTMGARGSRLIGPAEDSFMIASQVPVADTVGAGDAFAAALAVGLLQGLPLRAIHANATQLAGFVCSRQGAVPAMEAIREFIETLSAGRTA